MFHKVNIAEQNIHYKNGTLRRKTFLITIIAIFCTEFQLLKWKASRNKGATYAIIYTNCKRQARSPIQIGPSILGRNSIICPFFRSNSILVTHIFCSGMEGPKNTTNSPPSANEFVCTISKRLKYCFKSYHKILKINKYNKNGRGWERLGVWS